MKKIYQTNSPYWGRLLISFLVAFPLLGIMQAQAQTITINSEPSSPLYVGDTIEVEYSSSGFSAEAVFYLVVADDTLIGTNSNASGTFTATVPAGYDPSAVFTIYGVSGDPDGMVETKPLFGELQLAGTSTSYSYDAETYNIYFWEPNIRRMTLPGIDMVGDTAYFEFDYEYDAFADTLELVVEYSKDGGSNFTRLDTVEYADFARHENYRVGIPATARTGNTIL